MNEEIRKRIVNLKQQEMNWRELYREWSLTENGSALDFKNWLEENYHPPKDKRTTLLCEKHKEILIADDREEDEL